MRRTGLREEAGKLLALIRLGNWVVDGMVKLIELLINIVNLKELKVLKSSNQKVSSQANLLGFEVTRMMNYRRKGRT
jgi:hypothetical protein